MKTIRTFEAKTHLSALLEQVERGEEITITRHGKAMARLVPVEAVSQEVGAHRGAAQELSARASARRSVRQGADRGRAAVTGCVIDASSVLAWFYSGPEVPVFLITLFAKGGKVDLSQAERNEMKRELAGLVEDYRRGAMRHVRSR
jgi:prevent-host-death family protein